MQIQPKNSEEKTYPTPAIQAWINRVVKVIAVVGMLNLTTYLLGAHFLKGTAKKVENGRYFVSDHGNLTEVTRTQFVYSQFHDKTVWITTPIMFATFFFYVPEKKK